MMMALVEGQEAGTEARRVGSVVCLRNRKEAPIAGAPGAWDGRMVLARHGRATQVSPPQSKRKLLRF